MVYIIWICILCVTNLYASEWQIEKVDSVGDVGLYTDIVIGESDYPHISYMDRTTEAKLKYAKWTGTSWIIEEITDGGVGSSIALDSDNRPHISHYTTWNQGNKMKYTYYDGTSWNTLSIDTLGSIMAGTELTSIVLDNLNHPHITYYVRPFSSGGNSYLKYAHWDGTSWDIKTIEAGSYVGMQSSLKLDNAGHPCVAYSYNFGTLKYARWNGSTWVISTVGPGGNFCSLVLDNNDYPHISHGRDNTLWYSYWDGSNWQSIQVDPQSDTWWYTSIILDDENNPHISYFQLGDYKDLKYAWWDGTDWVIERVDTSGNTGWGSSVAIDSNGCLHISYYNYTPNGDLMHAWKCLEEGVSSKRKVSNLSYIEPNPSLGRVKIYFPISPVHIFNTSGRKILSLTSSPKIINLPPGIYFVKGGKLTKKLIILSK